MKLGIYGSGGLGKEIYEVALRRNNVSSLWDEIFFIDDINPEGHYFGTQRMSFESLLSVNFEFECIVALGEPSIRQMLYSKLATQKINITRLIDPSAIISPTCHIEVGAIVCEFSTIHTGVELGANVLVQPFCDLGHDIKVGEHSVLSPHCAPGGCVVFGRRVFAGMHACILEKTNIGDDAVIGMGAVVYRDVLAGTTVIGNPARETKSNAQNRVFPSKVINNSNE